MKVHTSGTKSLKEVIEGPPTPPNFAGGDILGCGRRAYLVIEPLPGQIKEIVQTVGLDDGAQIKFDLRDHDEVVVKLRGSVQIHGRE